MVCHSQTAQMTKPSAESPQVVLIAGLSASGKTTFLKALKSGRLSSDITDQLPSKCSNWPIFEANKICDAPLTKNMLVANPDVSSGIFVHYDIADIRRHSNFTYADDPRLSFISEGIPWHLLHISTSLDRLRQQYANRTEVRREEKTKVKQYWARSVKPAINALRRRIDPSRPLDRTQLYSNANESRAILEKWACFVESLEDSHKPRSTLHVAPSKDSNEEDPTFNVASLKPS